jgi:NitT/TauT family transport system substrate-binding protein
MRLTRLARLTSALLAGSIVLTGCGATAKVASAPTQLTHIKVGILPAIDVVPLYIAQERGYFKQEGLDVELVTEPAGPPAVTAILNGDMDFSFLDYVMFFGTASRGAKTHVVADAYQIGPETQPLLTLPNSPIRTPRDLAGKRIGVLAPGNIQSLLINEQVKAYGVDPKSLHYVAVPFPLAGTALKKGDVDAVSTVEPFSTDAESKYGAVLLTDMDTGATENIPVSGYVSSDAWAKAHPAALAGFRRAIQRASVDASQRALVQHVLTKYLKLDAQAAAIVHIGTFPTSLSVQRLKRIADLMSEANMLAHPVDVAALAS